MKPIIAPSILSADFGCLDRDLEMVNESVAGWFHLDIMDGTFVPNISFGFPVCKAIASVARKPLDAHLMIVNPHKYVERFASLGVSYLSVHIETCGDLDRVLKQIRSAGMKCGIAINPETDASLLKGHLGNADFVLVMSVHPGFSGQSFIEGSAEKVAVVRKMIEEEGASCFIEVDGGINTSNIASLAGAGASVFVAGNSAFGAPDKEGKMAAIEALAAAASI